MTSFSLLPEEAFREVHEALQGDLPVTAAFRMPNQFGTGLVISVDGEPMNVYITLNRDGTWNAMWFKEALK